MILEQVRECDGICCHESPIFPTDATQTECRYHEDGPSRCRLMSHPAPSLLSEVIGEQVITGGIYQGEGLALFQERCVGWPIPLVALAGQEYDYEHARRNDTGGCCWQWVDG